MVAENWSNIGNSLSLSLSTHMYIIVSSHFDISTILLLLLPLLLILLLALLMAGKIEDPFEQPENSARAVKISWLARISEAFEISRHRFSSTDQNQDSLLVTLVRSQVSQEIRARLSNPVSYGGGYQPHSTHPHVHRNVNLQAETQNKFQNLRLKSNSNNPTLTETVNMYGKFEASESKMQNQFQNSRLESRSYNPSMTEIVQAQSQGQHRWRPKSDG